jgi:allophanate hydrolase subunit 2
MITSFVIMVYYTTLKFVTVFSLDLAKLAQQHPATKVRFQLIDVRFHHVVPSLQKPYFGTNQASNYD